MSTDLVLRINGARAELILTPPEGRPPTFDHAALDQLDAQLAVLETVADDQSVRVVFVRSASPRFFCVGADINALRHLDAASVVPWVEHGHRVFNRLESLPIPVIARVEGYALGGGLELALAADLILATPAAQLAQTEAKLGFVAGWGGSWRLPRRVGAARAKEMFFTGRMLTAAEAVTVGLVDECVAPEALEARCDQLARDIAECAPLAVRELKRLVTQAPELAREDSAAAEAGASSTCLQSPETQRRVSAFLEKRKKPAT